MSSIQCFPNAFCTFTRLLKCSWVCLFFVCIGSFIFIYLKGFCVWCRGFSRWMVVCVFTCVMGQWSMAKLSGWNRPSSVRNYSFPLHMHTLGFFSLSVSHNVLNQIPFKYFLHIITKPGRCRPLTFQAKYCRFSEAYKLPGALSRTDDILLYMLRSHSDGVCRSRWWCWYRSVKGSPLTQWEPLLLSTAGEKSSLSLNFTSPSFLPLTSRSH